MPVGRKPKPKHLKLLEGNPGKRPLNHNEPRPRPVAPTPPTWLSKEAEAEWKRVVPELDKLGLLTVVDRAALVAYCEAWSAFKEGANNVKRNGPVIEVKRERFSRNGDLLGEDTVVLPNPAIRVQKVMADQVRAFGSEFGLTPFSRSKLTVPEPTEDELEGIMSPAQSAPPPPKPARRRVAKGRRGGA